MKKAVGKARPKKTQLKATKGIDAPVIQFDDPVEPAPIAKNPVALPVPGILGVDPALQVFST